MNWNKPVNLPLSPAGEISEINRGAAIVEIPMPILTNKSEDKEGDNTFQAMLNL